MKTKNTAAFVLALIGAIFGLIGGILWSACADALGSVESAVSGENSATAYLVCFIIFGIGGAVLALIGGIQAFGFKKGAIILLGAGLLFQVVMLIVACIAVSGFSFLLNLCTIVSIILLVIALVFAYKNRQN